MDTKLHLHKTHWIEAFFVLWLPYSTNYSQVLMFQMTNKTYPIIHKTVLYYLKFVCKRDGMFSCQKHDQKNKKKTSYEFVKHNQPSTSLNPVSDFAIKNCVEGHIHHLRKKHSDLMHCKVKGVKLCPIQVPMRLNFSLWRPNPEN